MLKPLIIWAENLLVMIVLLISLFFLIRSKALLVYLLRWSILFFPGSHSSHRTYSLLCSNVCDCFFLLCRIPSMLA